MALSFLGGDPQIPYELGCLCCELGHLKEATEHLGVAFLSDSRLKLKGMENSLLEEIW